MDDIYKEFLIESLENLEQFDKDLLTLESSPTQDVLSSIFRTIHTIKGTCGFFGFGKLQALTHVAENLLSCLRDGELGVDAEITNALLATGDAVRDILACIEEGMGEGDGDYSALMEDLKALREGGKPDGGSKASSSEQTPAAQALPAEAPAPPPVPPESGAAESAPAPATSKPAAAVPAPATGGKSAGKSANGGGPSDPPDIKSSSLASSTIRVDVGVLDKLMNLVGELVLARNQILQMTGDLNDAALTNTTNRLNLTTTELQEGVMKARMQPIGRVWDQVPRLVRETAKVCGKRVRIEMEGEDTELDKTILESIKDPLTHIVRNSVDHGFESPEERTALGKAPEGRMVLRAYHEGGQVNIEIADDGGGINVERVRNRALERGLVRPDRVAQMSDREIMSLIFAPGFSTAEAISNVSGRGVGMDVVRTNVEKIGGVVDLDSRPGEGTTIRLKIPLTLAIIPALIVHCGEHRFAIPQVSLLKLVRLEGDRVRSGIENIHGAPVYRLRGNLLSLVSLKHELGLTDDRAPFHSMADAPVVNIIVLKADSQPFGLVVDAIGDSEEIVVKPLDPQLKSISAFSGATILGDGTVALILDEIGLAKKARVVAEDALEKAVRDDMHRLAAEDSDQQSYLMVAIGDLGRGAIPLASVDRLEKVEVEKIEWAAGREVVQYRGEIMPLVRLASVLREPPPSNAAERQQMDVVVYAIGGKRVGVVVDAILDIVEQATLQPRECADPVIVGSVVIRDKISDLLDLTEVVRAAGIVFDDSEMILETECVGAEA